MTRRRFYAPLSAFDSSLTRVTLASDEARHLREVLRLKVGDEVYVFNGAGKEFQCRIEETRRDAARLMVVREVGAARPESPLHLTLAVALLKGEKFDLVVQKATELGVSVVVPVVTKLADIRLRDESDVSKRLARWQRIALEAAKRSDFYLPKIFMINFAPVRNKASPVELPDVFGAPRRVAGRTDGALKDKCQTADSVGWFGRWLDR
jgi:RsmE family RNA methyltransferase